MPWLLQHIDMSGDQGEICADTSLGVKAHQAERL